MIDELVLDNVVSFKYFRNHISYSTFGTKYREFYIDIEPTKLVIRSYRSKEEVHCNKLIFNTIKGHTITIDFDRMDIQ